MFQMFFQSLFWRIVKRLLLATALLIVLTVAGSLFFVHQKKEWILGELIAYLNSRQSGKIKIGSADIALFRYLPNVGIEINDLGFFENDSIISAEPILHADQMYVTFNIWALVRESELDIQKAGIRNGRLNLEEDSTGVLNLTRAAGTPQTTGEQALTIDLKSVTLDSMMIRWKPFARPREAVLFVNKLQTSIAYQSGTIACRLRSTQELRAFYFKNTLITDDGKSTVKADLSFDQSRQLLTVHSGSLQYKEFTADLKGSYGHTDKALEIYFDASSSDFPILSALINKDILKLNPALLQHGKIYAQGKLFGKLADGRPQVELNFGAKDIDLKLPDKLREFRKVGFDATFRSGEPDDLSDAMLEVKNIRGRVPGGSIKGDIRIRNFKKPDIRYRLYASARLDGYDRIFNVGFLKDLKGLVSLQSDFAGSLDFSKPDPGKSPATATLTFKNLAFTLTRTKKRVSQAHGKLALADYAFTFSDIGFQYDSSNIRLDGTLTHPYHLVFNHEENVEAFMHVSADKFLTKDFITDTLRTASVQDKISDLQFDLALASTVTKIRTRRFPDLTFIVANLSGRFEKLADIRNLSASGRLETDTLGFKWKLSDLVCRLSSGSFSLSGTLIKSKKNSLEIDARLNLDQFPLRDAVDLVRELQSNLKVDSTGIDPAKETVITADFGISSTLQQTPFAVKDLEIVKGRVDARLGNATHWKSDNFNLHARDLFFNHSPDSAITGVRSIAGELDINRLALPNGGVGGLRLKIPGVENPGENTFALRDIDLHVDLPHGSVHLSGDMAMPAKNTLTIDVHAGVDRMSLRQLNELWTPVQPVQPSKAARSSFVDKTEIISADLNLRSTVHFDPLSIEELDATRNSAAFQLESGTLIRTGPFALRHVNLIFEPSTPAGGPRLKSAGAVLNFDSLHVPPLGKTAVRLKVDGSNDHITISFSTGLLRAKHDEGNLSVDLSGERPRYNLKYSISQARLEAAETIIDNKSIKGPIDVYVDLKSSGTGGSVLDSLKGTVRLRGDSLTLYGFDLDQLLKDYRKSQNFNLVDVGAYMVAGVAGAVVTKSSDFIRLLSTSTKTTDKTELIQVVSNCKVSEGLMTTEDVAFSTRENRIALIGNINIQHDSIPGLLVAVVDKNGCSLVDQRVYGKFNNLKTGKLKVAGTLLGSVTNLANTVADKGCEQIYDGTVRHPSRK